MYWFIISGWINKNTKFWNEFSYQILLPLARPHLKLHYPTVIEWAFIHLGIKNIIYWMSTMCQLLYSVFET